MPFYSISRLSGKNRLIMREEIDPEARILLVRAVSEFLWQRKGRREALAGAASPVSCLGDHTCGFMRIRKQNLAYQLVPQTDQTAGRTANTPPVLGRHRQGSTEFLGKGGLGNEGALPADSNQLPTGRVESAFYCRERSVQELRRVRAGDSLELPQEDYDLLL